MKIKKLMSISTLCLVGVLGIGLLTGCNDEDEDGVVENDDTTTDDDGETGPRSGLVFDNLLAMLSGFTFEGSIDIAYDDIEIGLEFNNGEAVVPLDMSDYSFDVSKLAVGGDLTIVYDSYEITLGVTYLDSTVYVDYGEDSYWNEGVGDSVHFYMENSDIGDLINLFSSDDDEASSVDWEELFGLNLDNFDPIDLAYGLNDMSLTTAANGDPAFDYPLTPLGINDSLLIHTNDNSECTGLECTDLVLGEFTLSIDLSLATKKGLEVTTPEELSTYVDLACVTPLVDRIVELVDCEYFVFEGTITLGMSVSTLGGLVKASDEADINTTLTMRVYDGGHFTMQIDCDIPAASVSVSGVSVDITGYGGGQLDTVDHSKLTVYYDSEDGYTYYYHIDYSCQCEDCADTYEEWGMLSGHEFGSNPFKYILGNMIGCGSDIQEALGGSDDESLGFEFTIPSSLNGLISGISTEEVVDEDETRLGDKLELDLILASLFGGEDSMFNEAVIATTIYDNHEGDSIYALVPIEGTGSVTVGYYPVSYDYEFDIIIDLALTDSGSVDTDGKVNGSDPFEEFETYIAAHTCSCEECGGEEGECCEDCDCCTDGECGCYFIKDQTVSVLTTDEDSSCSCEECECNGECTCDDCTCTTDDGGDTESDDEEP